MPRKFANLGTAGGDFDYILVNGAWRRLDRRPAHLARLAAAAPAAPAVEPLDPRDWWETGEGPDVPILDQSQWSSCAGNMMAGMLMDAFLGAGIAVPTLSASYIYSLCNGGRDAGAVISDTLQVALQYGTCTASTAPERAIYRYMIPPGADAEAQRYRAAAGGPIGTWAEYVTSILLRHPVGCAVTVGEDFEGGMDAEGVVPITPGYPNHATRGGRVVRLRDGRWAVEQANSWGIYGPLGGRFRITEAHWDQYRVSQDAVFISAVRPDPTLEGVAPAPLMGPGRP